MIHPLKTWPIPFQAIWDGHKYYEIRKFDRPYSVKDILLLREYFPEEKRFSGREILCRVTHITPPGTWGLPQNIGVMGIEVTEHNELAADDISRWR